MNETDDEASTTNGEDPPADTPTTQPAPARRPLSTANSKRPQYLPLAVLRRHPKNPRVAYRNEVVEKIAAELRRTKRFLPQYALTVRPIGDGLYEIISGHQRCKAAEQAEIQEVACWVVELSDEQAFYELLLANSQSEMSALEIGIHYLDALANGSVKSIQAYADRVHLKRANVSVYQKGAGVLRALGDRLCPGDWLDKAQHLAHIADAPEEKRPELAERCLKEKWSARQTRAEVTRLAAPATESKSPQDDARRVAFGETIDISTASAVLTLPSVRVCLEPVRDALGAVASIRVLKPGDLKVGVAVERVPVVSGSVVSCASISEARPLPHVPATTSLVSVSRASVESKTWKEMSPRMKTRLRLLAGIPRGRSLDVCVTAADSKSAFGFVSGSRAGELRSIFRNRRSVIDDSLLLAGLRPVADPDAEHPERAGAVVLVAYGETRSADRMQKVTHVAVAWYDRDEARPVTAHSFLRGLGLALQHPVRLFEGGELGEFIGAWWGPA